MNTNLDLKQFTKCETCSTRSTAVMVHRADLAAHRAEHARNDSCCDVHPAGYDGESPCRTLAVTGGR